MPDIHGGAYDAISRAAFPGGTARIATQPFQTLGFDRETFYYLSDRGGQVIGCSGEKLGSIGTLLQLAPLGWWENSFPPVPGSTGMNFKGAQHYMIDQAYQAGVFDPDRIRGRGVWIEADGSVVVHMGDQLIVEGQALSPIEWSGASIYERQRRLDLRFAVKGASDDEAKRLIEVCNACPWDDAELVDAEGKATASMGRILAGWITVAPFCGAMPWRPHIWLTSEAGAGKSWVQGNVIQPMLAGLCIAVQGKTTEPGLRGKLQRDALPIIFDEAETQNSRDIDRIQQVLDLARQASQEDGAGILKGTQKGGYNEYRIRSMFVFSSVNVGLSQAADESRAIVLSLRPARDGAVRAAHFAELKRIQTEVITPEFAARLRTRTLRLLPVIRQNAETFAAAIARAGGARRTGDTIGVPLAGAWSLQSEEVVTKEQADRWVAGTPWIKAAIDRAEAEPEWKQCLNRLLGQRIRVPGRTEDVPIGELVSIAGGQADPGEPGKSKEGRDVIRKEDAESALRRHGMRIGGIGPAEAPGEAMLMVSTSSADAVSWFRDTPWASGWKVALGRAPGASAPRKVFRVGAGTAVRVIAIPLEAL